jgi:glycosyltransferase involved in cell wall biosynthesis
LDLIKLQRQSKIINVDVSIDIVIPSFRLDEKYILPVLELTTPPFVKTVFYLVVDNPEARIPDSVKKLVDNRRVFLLINDKNRGASFTRNRGMDEGSGAWVLFLDDDLIVPENLLNVYTSAILSFPEEIGFIGLVQLPDSVTDFSKAILISGSMDIFSIAARRPSFVWGATANFLIRRSAIGDERFSLLFPKSGGGEDVDFFLRIREKNGYRNYKSLPEAKVYHPWWNEGRPDFKKPYRYGVGNSLLGELNPGYAYMDLLNTIETLAVCIPVLLIFTVVKPRWIFPLLLFMCGALLIEAIATVIQTKKRSLMANARTMFFVLALRLSNEYGLLSGNLSRFRIRGIGERFHDDGKQNKIFFYRTNTHKIVKWILYPLMVYVLFRLFF